ncbi:hypothetical protein HanXRQr2_Chr00c001g0832331 [Helianthus annuus]|uniref:Uncharacterized protein n=1 Tax=Helianthus annuus TaxID=4232 RepID=A0A9K3JZQ5_HELAN|nr:hypothetical protein HanXRQr2_Chr00c001g0832331 [Helianthus annuus]
MFKLESINEKGGGVLMKRELYLVAWMLKRDSIGDVALRLHDGAVGAPTIPCSLNGQSLKY